MTPSLILLVFGLYTLLLFFVTWLTSRRANSETFYTGNRRSPWFVVAYGMIGASLSGVTFMSVPGWVQNTQFTYMGMVVGFLVGYFVIAHLLLPLYYRLNLTSIYTYLEQRFGVFTYKSGASYFILSRSLGASLRMFLVVNVLYEFVFRAWGVPFWLTGAIFVLLILLYTLEGGIRTIVWTDTLQTTFMLGAVVLSFFLIAREMGFDPWGLVNEIRHSSLSQSVVTDWHDKRFWLKQIVSGIFITIVMTGLDQEMMQKNLSCRNLRDAQKNMITFSFTLVAVNLFFLFLGAALVLYAQKNGISVENTDTLFPEIAIHHLGILPGLVFVIGLISAAYPSADGALTSLTTSCAIDLVGIEKRGWNAHKQKRVRYAIHFSFALLFLALIVAFRYMNNSAVIDKLYTISSYTYGPLLGFFAFGMLTRRQVRDVAVPAVALLSPVLCYLLNAYSARWLWGYQFGFELLIVNGLITFTGLWLLRIPASKREDSNSGTPDSIREIHSART